MNFIKNSIIIPKLIKINLMYFLFLLVNFKDLFISLFLIYITFIKKITKRLK